eukprot:m.48876 g.48876  ORF g.48876 m.48876 type:complete len:508 (-) comp15278_c0_seq6:1508-3031(-)
MDFMMPTHVSSSVPLQPFWRSPMVAGCHPGAVTALSRTDKRLICKNFLPRTPSSGCMSPIRTASQAFKRDPSLNPFARFTPRPDGRGFTCTAEEPVAMQQNAAEDPVIYGMNGETPPASSFQEPIQSTQSDAVSTNTPLKNGSSSARSVTVNDTFDNGVSPVRTAISLELSTPIRTLQDPAPSQERMGKFLAVLKCPTVNLEHLRSLSWSGVPADVRPTVWRLLSGYLPANSDRRPATLARRRSEYRVSVDQHYPRRFDPSHEQMLHQIQVDILRSTPTSLFAQPLTKQMFERMLFIFHVRHPGSGYVQGMNDLAVPFFTVFLSPYFGHDNADQMVLADLDAATLAEIEADCYWCTSILIDKIQDYFTADRPGLQRQLAALRDLIGRIDAPLNDHLDSFGVTYIQFAFRWMNCLLMRELPLPPIVRLWDAYLAEDDGFSTLHLYTCAALLKSFSAQIKATADMSETMIFVLNLPTHTWTPRDVAVLLAEAYRLKFTFADAHSHLAPQ